MTFSIWRESQSAYQRSLWTHRIFFSVRLPNQRCVRVNWLFGLHKEEDFLTNWVSGSQGFLSVRLVPLYRILMLRYSDSVLNRRVHPRQGLQHETLSLVSPVVHPRHENTDTFKNCKLCCYKTLFKQRFNNIITAPWNVMPSRMVHISVSEELADSFFLVVYENVVSNTCHLLIRINIISKYCLY